MPRFRRARALQVHWQDGDLIIENFVSRVAVSAAPVTLTVLSAFDDWRSGGSVASELGEWSRASIARAIRELVAHSLLLTEGSEAARLDEQVSTTWKHWRPAASFHFSTKDAPFASPRQWARIAPTFLAESPQPGLVKTYPGHPKVSLPDAGEPDSEFLRVLLARKTHREFSSQAMPLGSLATLLRYTWGAVDMVHSPNFGPLLRKTSPSGGARHPAEVYVAALKVDGLRAGLYHYNHQDHVLERLRAGPMRDVVLRQSLGQQHVGNACAVCYMTAFLPRSMYKYRAPRAYRTVSLETGHLAQTFCLVATWLGLAPFTTAALVDTDIERSLGIDGVEETILYIAGVGMPKRIRAKSPAAGSRPRASAGRKRRPRS
ncbi:MAG TPA: SagB family peptide dehydrogenase [Gemmatimonadales bacterium]|nr:SagB family peptide dehydrogenase [Gemmatimonadales bacterium]